MKKEVIGVWLYKTRITIHLIFTAVCKLKKSRGKVSFFNFNTPVFLKRTNSFDLRIHFWKFKNPNCLCTYKMQPILLNNQNPVMLTYHHSPI